MGHFIRIKLGTVNSILVNKYSGNMAAARKVLQVVRVCLSCTCQNLEASVFSPNSVLGAFTNQIRIF